MLSVLGLAKNVAPASRRHMSSDMGFGTKAFIGAVADKYLKKHGLSAATLDDPMWPSKHADGVAAAIKDWGMDNKATVFTHWFQPLGANAVRHGMTGQVHNNMMTFAKDGQPQFKFSGKELLRGETDGSSYPSGGLRATHTAGGYTVVDATSPIFMRGDTIFIPTIFMSWTGFALDEKIPLLRSCEALDKEGKRLLKNLGLDAKGVQPNIGLEQEFFFVPRDAYARRLDLQMTGRTVIGKQAPRGQEMCDHYMAAINQFALEAMTEIQNQCFQLGIPLRTRHREVAPNQYEFAPMFGYVTSQIDQNLMVMQIAEEVSAKYGLACLMQEKPFQGVNGSGKHNNWSMSTTDGVNLLNPTQINDACKNPDAFNAIISSIMAAVDKHGDLMRMSIACPGNDFRLGACEAPPAIISTYLGESLSEHLEQYINGGAAAYVPKEAILSAGISNIAPFTVPVEDRNRTSPFPYGGHRFEFRAVGSSQNASMVNTVLNTITAEAFAEFSTQLEAGKSVKDVAIPLLKKHWRVVFNGDGYSEEWPTEATKRGIWRIDSGVEAMRHISSEENVAMFEKMNVMNKAELEARKDVMYTHYTGIVEIECLSMIDMIVQQIIPAMQEANLDTAALVAGAKKLQTGLAAVHHEEDGFKKADLARNLRLEIMMEVREVCDSAEAICPANLWPIATYKELLFLDSQQDGNGQTTVLN